MIDVHMPMFDRLDKTFSFGRSADLHRAASLWHAGRMCGKLAEDEEDMHSEEVEQQTHAPIWLALHHTAACSQQRWQQCKQHALSCCDSPRRGGTFQVLPNMRKRGERDTAPQRGQQ